ncbi:hypothetical protein HMN09_00476400 [Mycena chlorophos]|uniref:BTB domain-containing protein n=1 Tax=Mycena chlorophos TaxID=658473 RepID=A0A8H6WHV8_MYCCL|nr:hypothetical protein HMN09_00476400 [Mycena chlorophos]
MSEIVALPARDTWIHHPDFYNPLSPLVFLLAPYESDIAILYRFGVDTLARRSAFFRDTFSLPRGPQTPAEILREGVSDESPIILPRTLSQDVMDAVLIYIFNASHEYPKKTKFLINLVNGATLFGIPDGITWVQKEFNRNSFSYDSILNAPLEFYIGRRFNIDNLITSGFDGLLLMSFSGITVDNIQQIGEEALQLLLDARAEIEAARKNLAYDGPAYAADEHCETQAVCGQTWDGVWRAIAFPALNHPSARYRLCEIRKVMEAHLGSMCKECKEKTFEAADYALQREERYLARVRKAVEDRWVGKGGNSATA